MNRKLGHYIDHGWHTILRLQMNLFLKLLYKRISQNGGYNLLWHFWCSKPTNKKSWDWKSVHNIWITILTQCILSNSIIGSPWLWSKQYMIIWTLYNCTSLYCIEKSQKCIVFQVSNTFLKTNSCQPNCLVSDVI